MKSKKDIYVTLGRQGQIVLPPELIKRYGLKAGHRVPVTADTCSFKVRQPISHLQKLYIEPTNACNLKCTTCIRNIWNEPLGQMADETFDCIMKELRKFPASPVMVLGGLGEPLMHPGIVDMVSAAKKSAMRVELITNGTLLTEALSLRLIKAGLDVLWVSIDGAEPERYAEVRPGAALPEVIENVARFRDYRHLYHCRIGIVFVAMKQNIADLPDVMVLGRKLGADRFLITNLLPYTEEMCAEALYTDTVWSDSVKAPSPLAPQLQSTRIDLNEHTCSPLYRIVRGWRISNPTGDDLSTASNHCPFIESGSAALSWDGSISPCIPLMHTHISYLHNRRRVSRRYSIGAVNDGGFEKAWKSPEYVGFREKVQSFDFPPCTHCGGCKLSQANEEDCFGNGFPTCGGCLWAQGIIRCP